jgi:hypothetical protein
MKKLWTLSGISGIILFVALGFSGCDTAKIRAIGDLGAKSNNAGTLSVPLPVNAPAPDAGNSPENESPQGNRTPETSGPIIEIKEKVFIAQTNDVYLNPDDYLGKTIKLEGLFRSDTYEGTGVTYNFVLRLGPGCCGNDGSAGFEVSWEALDENSGVPRNPAQVKPPLLPRTRSFTYPNEDDWVEAIGVLKTYLEDGYPYLYIHLSSLTVLDQRGAEFVTH